MTAARTSTTRRRARRLRADLWEKSGAGDGHHCAQSSSQSCQNLIGMLAPAKLEVEELLEQVCQQVIGTCPRRLRGKQRRLGSGQGGQRVGGLEEVVETQLSADGKVKQMEMKGARAMDKANTAHARYQVHVVEPDTVCGDTWSRRAVALDCPARVAIHLYAATC